MEEKTYHDTDSAKQYLNCEYGVLAVEKYSSFIVLHKKSRPALFRKDSIDAIIELSSGNVGLRFNGWLCDVDETYEEVVRKLFE